MAAPFVTRLSRFWTVHSLKSWAVLKAWLLKGALRRQLSSADLCRAGRPQLFHPPRQFPGPHRLPARSSLQDSPAVGRQLWEPRLCSGWVCVAASTLQQQQPSLSWGGPYTSLGNSVLGEIHLSFISLWESSALHWSNPCSLLFCPRKASVGTTLAPELFNNLWSGAEQGPHLFLPSWKPVLFHLEPQEYQELTSTWEAG